MVKVSGSTNQFIYENNYKIDPILNFGYSNKWWFYQGYYKLDGNSYEVLPVRVNQSWSAEFWIKPNSTVLGNTLNNKYPDNKGIFFFWAHVLKINFGIHLKVIILEILVGALVGVLVGVQYLKKDIVLLGDYNINIPLNPPLINIKLEFNPFLYMVGQVTNSTCSCGRKHDGLGTETACSYSGGGVPVITYSQNQTTNPFIYMGK
jgi:hypothetical protein